jgi:hypothetical protein
MVMAEDKHGKHATRREQREREREREKRQRERERERERDAHRYTDIQTRTKSMRPAHPQA